MSLTRRIWYDDVGKRLGTFDVGLHVCESLENIRRDEKGGIISGCTSLFPVITNEVLETVAKDSTITAVLLKDPTRKFLAGSGIELLKGNYLHFNSDELLLTRGALFGSESLPQQMVDAAVTRVDGVKLENATLFFGG